MNSASAEKLKGFIEEVIRHSGMSASALARKAGLAGTTVTRFLRDPQRHMPSARTVAALCEAARIENPFQLAQEMPGGLAGKTALVTGAGRGIGRAIAAALAREGATVAVNDLAPPEATAAEIGGGAFAVAADVADEGAVLTLFAEIDRRFGERGGLDIVVNNAGVIRERPLLETEAADFDRVLAVNLRGTFLVGREAIRRMVRHGGGRGGRVINVASELAYLGRARVSPYCASKAGVIALTRSWAREFAPDILVNAVAPGPVDTDMLNRPDRDPAARGAEAAGVPLGRIGRPEEVAAAAVFLAGPGASFMTGQTLGPNGGAVMV